MLTRWRTPAFRDEDARFLTECLRAGLLSDELSELDRNSSAELAGLRNIESEFAALARRTVPGVVESSGFDQALYQRGNHMNPVEPVSRAFLAALGGTALELKDETGRLQLAREIIAPDNPLFPRVIANRIWFHVFGEERG